MNSNSTVNPTQVSDAPATPSHITEVLQVSTSPTPENGVYLGATPAASNPAASGNQADHGVGIEGEETVWTGRYSYKNYTVRFLLRTIATIGWLIALGYFETRQQTQDQWNWTWFLRISAGLVMLYWLSLVWQVIIGRLGHSYHLTNRRLFVDTGLFRRRRDQMELLKVQDVYVKQPNLFSRMLDIGTVVIETSEERLPIHYLAGVDSPHPLMDLIWHQARKERDLRSVKVDQV